MGGDGKGFVWWGWIRGFTGIGFADKAKFFDLAVALGTRRQKRAELGLLRGVN